MSAAKTTELIEVPRVWTPADSEQCIRWGHGYPYEKGHFFGGGARREMPGG